jgi:F-type H+-transporting ATPase subunit epsilon
MNGDFTAMPAHAPLRTTLRPGVLRVVAGAEITEFVVTGGFAEVSPTAATILAEYATLRSEVDRGMITDLLAEAERQLADAEPEARMAAGQRVRDLIGLQSQVAH